MVAAKKVVSVRHIISERAGKWHLFTGILMMLLGIFMCFNPVETLVAIALYLGIVFVVVGAAYFMASFSIKSGWYLAIGILDIIVGMIMISNLGLSVASLPIIFAVWCLVAGAAQIMVAYQYHKSGQSSNWLSVSGILGVIFGILLLAYPIVGSLTLALIIGLYVVFYGLAEIAQYASWKA